MAPRSHPGFTVSEVFTALVAIVVLTAIAVPVWRTNELRVRRGDAIEALLAVQAAQDQFFGKNARYANETQLAAAPPGGLGIKPASMSGFYAITVQNSDDDLAYQATARVIARERHTPDARCVELRIDQNGRRFAVDSEGADRSADCWR